MIVVDCRLAKLVFDYVLQEARAQLTNFVFCSSVTAATVVSFGCLIVWLVGSNSPPLPPFFLLLKASAEDEQRLTELVEKEIVGRNLLGGFGPLLVTTPDSTITRP